MNYVIAPPTQQQCLANVKEQFITVDSRDRDISAFPSASVYEIRINPSSTYTGALLQKNYKNIKTIEFLNAIYPNVNSVLNEMYLYLTIPEIEGSFDSTNSAGLKAIAKLIPTHVYGGWVYSHGGETITQKKVYDVSMKRLDKLTIEFRRYDGSIFDFGSASTSQTSVTLRITTCDYLIE
jgi:hypothetical protein